MRTLRYLLAAALVLVVALNASAAPKAGKAKAKKAKPVTGVVVDVQKDADKDTGTLTLKVAPKKKDAAGEAMEKKFTFSEKTKVVKVSGKKGEQQTTDASIKDVEKAQRLTVTAKGDAIQEIKILVGKKAKKKNK
jgi:hypothetical protein